MPDINASLHLEMFENFRIQQSKVSKLRRVTNFILGKKNIYGLEWGDPDKHLSLIYIKNHFLLPYLLPSAVLVEIGPGGGRWTRYMLNVKQIYAVDYYQEILDELKLNVNAKNIRFLKNNGDDFPGIPEKSIDFIFSFGTFVHLDLDIIDRYLQNIKPLLKPKANVFIQYSDKTKPLGQSNHGFSDNNPEKMRNLLTLHQYTIYEEDLKTLGHSSMVRFGLAKNNTPI